MARRASIDTPDVPYLPTHFMNLSKAAGELRMRFPRIPPHELAPLAARLVETNASQNRMNTIIVMWIAHNRTKYNERLRPSAYAKEESETRWGLRRFEADDTERRERAVLQTVKPQIRGIMKSWCADGTCTDAFWRSYRLMHRGSRSASHAAITLMMRGMFPRLGEEAITIARYYHKCTRPQRPAIELSVLLYGKYSATPILLDVAVL